MVEDLKEAEIIVLTPAGINSEAPFDTGATD